jgi:hypothetical protein
LLGEADYGLIQQYAAIQSLQQRLNVAQGKAQALRTAYKQQSAGGFRAVETVTRACSAGRLKQPLFFVVAKHRPGYAGLLRELADSELSHE